LPPGTGSFTEHILNRRQRRSKFIALETNAAFFAHLTGRWGPSSFVRRGAEEFREALDERGVHQVDVVVSGLPWASFRHHRQENILRQVSACLAPQGVFVTFAYLQGLLLPGGARFLWLLKQQFASVERTKVVWTNFPPALVYVCRTQACAAQEAA
jgi:phosphatidylethanolamine/phosphatidyl-N-methylethanolamine N-methyltransferase